MNPAHDSPSGGGAEEPAAARHDPGPTASGERVALRVIAQFLRQCVGGDADAVLAEFEQRHPGLRERLRSERAGLLADTAPAAAGGSARRFGPYRLLSELGRGGQGTVWLAEDLRIGRQVALKLVAGRLGGDGGGLPARVRREAEALARLDHPGLCVVYEAGEHEGQAFVALRHVPGESLALRVAQRRARLAERSSSRGSRNSAARREATTVLALVEQLALAVHAAHEAGVAHRDIKPDNVIVREDGQPVLLDFGLARAADGGLPELTATGDVLGTTAYLPPERLAGRTRAARDAPALLDVAGDVWALGVVLFELLTGQRPFEAATQAATVAAIARDEAPDPRRHDPALPADLTAVVAVALEKNPARRYASARALAEDLARVARGEPVAVRRLPRAVRAWRWALRHPARATLLAALLAGLAGTAFVARSFAELASRETQARRIAQAHQARSAADQARLLTAAETPGRRALALELLAQAAASRRQVLAETSGGEPSPLLAAALAQLPEPAALRSLAVVALRDWDLQEHGTIQSSTLGEGGFSASGGWLGVCWLSADFQSFGLRLLDVASGTERYRVESHEFLSGAFTVAVADSGETFAAPRPDGIGVGLWGLPDGSRQGDLLLPEALRPAAGGRPVWRLAFASAAQAVLAVTGPRADADAAAAAATPSALLLWKPERDPALRRAAPLELDGGWPWLAISPDGRLALAPLAPGEIAWIDVQAETLRAVPGPAGARQAAFGPPDEQGQPTLLVLLSGGAAAPGAPGGSPDTLWHGTSQGELLAQIELPFTAAPRVPLAVEPVQAAAVVGSADGTLALVDLRGARVARRIPTLHRSSLEDLRFTADGQRLLTHSRNEASLRWTLQVPAELVRPATPFPPRAPIPPVVDGAWHHPSPCGTVELVIAAEGVRPPALLAHGPVEWVELRDGRRRPLPGVPQSGFREVNHVRYSPDGRLLSALVLTPDMQDGQSGAPQADQHIVIWSVPQGEVVARLAVGDASRRVGAAFVGDGRLVALHAGSGRVRLVSLPSGDTLAEWDAEVGAVARLATAESGDLLVAGRDGRVVQWSLAALEEAWLALGLARED